MLAALLPLPSHWGQEQTERAGQLPAPLLPRQLCQAASTVMFVLLSWE